MFMRNSAQKLQKFRMFLRNSAELMWNSADAMWSSAWSMRRFEVRVLRQYFAFILVGLASVLVFT